jgi:hypothetical protein
MQDYPKGEQLAMADDNRKSRLASLFALLAEQYELPYTIDPDGLGVDVGIPSGDEMLFVVYTFDKSDDGYEFGSALGKVNESDIQELAVRILQSDSVPGITERLDDENRIVVLGGRNNLHALSDTDLQKGYMDDLARIAEIHERLKDFSDLLGNYSETE